MTQASYPIEILHITDPHILPYAGETLIGVDTAFYLDAVLKQATCCGHRYNHCLITGDLVQTACSDSYCRLLSILESYSLDFRCLPGNHDDVALLETILITPTVNCHKQLFLGNWQIVCLDSSVSDSDAGYLSPVELKFLESCLVENPGLFTLIAFHHHCIPTESSWMDSMIIGNAAELFALLDKYPRAKVIVSGHIHQQREANKNGLKILSTPSTCYQFAPYSSEFKLDNTMPGFRRLQLYADGAISTEVMRLPGMGAVAGLQMQIHGY